MTMWHPITSKLPTADAEHALNHMRRMPPRLGDSRLKHTVLEQGNYLLVYYKNDGEVEYWTIIDSPY